MSIVDTVDQRLGQAELPIARLQQDRPAIGTRALFVELGQHRAA
jgi:hypothetical protein